MRLLRYKLLPVFRKNKGISLFLCVVCALGMLLMITLSGFSLSLSASVDRFYKEFCIMPNVVYMLEEGVNEETISIDDSVLEWSGLMLYPAKGTSQSGRKLSFMAAAKDDNVLWQDVTKSEIEIDGDTDRIFVEISSEFADRSGVKTGDFLELDINGEKQKVYIGRIIENVSMFSVPRSDNTMYDNTEYGMLYMHKKDMEKLYGIPVGTVNCLQINLTKGNDVNQALLEIEQGLEESGIKISERIMTEDIDYFEAILTPVNSLTLVVPAAFMLIMLLMIVILLHTMIRSDREQIGILRAIGYSVGSITLLYCVYILLIVLAAFVISMAVGYGIIDVIMQVFCDTYGVPWQCMLDTEKSILAVLLTAVTGQLAVFICMAEIRKVKPAEAMRQGNQSRANISEKVGSILSRFGNLLKLMFSAALRNKVRFAVFTMILFLTSLMAIISLSVYTARNYIYTNTFPSRFSYDSMAVFDGEVTEDTLHSIGELDMVDSCENFSMSYDEVSFDDKTISVHLIGAKADAELVSSYNLKGERIIPKEDGIVLSESVAEKLGCRAGDILNVNGQEIYLNDISEDVYLGAVYCRQEVFDKFADKEKTSAVAIKMNCEATAENENSLADKLTKIDGYNYSLYSRIQREEMTYLFGIYDLAVTFVLVMAVLLGFSVVYVMSLIELSDRQRDYGILRAIGIKINTIAFAAYTESVVKFSLAIIGAVLAGSPVIKLLFELLSYDDLKLYSVNYFTVCILAGAIVLCYVTAAHFLAMHTIKRLKFTDVMKVRD